MSKALDRERRVDAARRTTAESRHRPKADPFKGNAADVPQPLQNVPARPLPRVANRPARLRWGVALLTVAVALAIIGAFAERARVPGKRSDEQAISSAPSDPAAQPDAQRPSAPDAAATDETRVTDAMGAALDDATRVLRLMDAAMRDAARLSARVQANSKRGVGESG